METQKKIFFLFCMSAVLLGFFLCQFPASALEPEDEPQDSGIILDIEDEPEEWEEPSESDSPETLPSEEDINLWDEEVPSTTPDMIDLDLSTVSTDVAAIRQNSDIFLYFVIPVSCAFFLICKFCVWFYSTFVKDAL